MSEMMMATLVHLGTNMWLEEDNKTQSTENYINDVPASPDLRLDRALWDAYMVELREAGNNTIIIDVGDGVVYDSHPEIAVNGAWSKAELAAEVKKLKGMGFSVIPKLNFSTTHDYWMKQYAMMVSTAPYYSFCADVIAELCEVFESEYFHIGMDEENYPLQAQFNYVVIRQNESWWRDLRFFVSEVEKHNARAILWADYAREHLEEFIENCPKTAIPMVWYYDNYYYGELKEFYAIRVRPLKALIDAGFEIMAAGSTFFHYENFPLLAEYCCHNLPAEKFLGLCQTVWCSVTPEFRDDMLKGLLTVKDAFKLMRQPKQ